MKLAFLFFPLSANHDQKPAAADNGTRPRELTHNIPTVNRDVEEKCSFQLVQTVIKPYKSNGRSHNNRWETQREAKERTGANGLQDLPCCRPCTSHQRNHHNNKKTPSHFFRSFLFFVLPPPPPPRAGRLLIIRAQVWRSRMLISLYANAGTSLAGHCTVARISVPPQACNYIYSTRGLEYWPPMKETDGPSFSVSRPDNPQASGARSTASSQKSESGPGERKSETEREEKAFHRNSCPLRACSLPS